MGRGTNQPTVPLAEVEAASRPSSQAAYSNATAGGECAQEGEDSPVTSRELLTFAPFALRTAIVGIALCVLLGPPTSLRAAQSPAETSSTRLATVESPQVTIDNFTFSPATLTVPSGTTVTWTNQDDMVHTVTEANRLFSSKGLESRRRDARAGGVSLRSDQ